MGMDMESKRRAIPGRPRNQPRGPGPDRAISAGVEALQNSPRAG